MEQGQGGWFDGMDQYTRDDTELGARCALALDAENTEPLTGELAVRGRARRASAPHTINALRNATGSAR